MTGSFLYVQKIPVFAPNVTLGGLYDARSDKVVPGAPFWQQLGLPAPDGSKYSVVERPSRVVRTIHSDDIESKCSALKLNRSMAYSLLGGHLDAMVSSGAGAYSTIQERSRNIARVTLKYESLSKYRRLRLDELVLLKPPADVADSVGATHVIVGVDYGCDAFFVLEREFSKGEENSVQEQLCAQAELMRLAMQGVQTQEDAKSGGLHTKCSVFADFPLRENPGTFENACDLASALGLLAGGHLVPKAIHVLPISHIYLDWSYSSVPLSASLLRTVRGVQQMIMDLSREIEEVLDEPKKGGETDFGRLKSQLDLISANLKQDLRLKLPLIRAGNDPETSLLDATLKWHEAVLSLSHVDLLLDRLRSADLTKYSLTRHRVLVPAELAASPAVTALKVEASTMGLLVPSAEGLEFLCPYKLDSTSGHISRYQIGRKSEIEQPWKSILIVGARAVGKSSFVSSLVNYVYGVKIEDKFRFKVDETTPSTITKCYNLYGGSQYPEPLTIIDSPGYTEMDHSKGLASVLSPEFLDTLGQSARCLHAVCLFVREDVSLSPEEFRGIIHLLGSILSISPQKIIIVVSTTTTHTPERHTLTYPIICNFNPSAFFNDVTSEEEVARQSWETGQHNFHSFFEALNQDLFESGASEDDDTSMSEVSFSTRTLDMSTSYVSRTDRVSSASSVSEMRTRSGSEVSEVDRDYTPRTMASKIDELSLAMELPTFTISPSLSSIPLSTYSLKSILSKMEGDQISPSKASVGGASSAACSSKSKKTSQRKLNSPDKPKLEKEANSGEPKSARVILQEAASQANSSSTSPSLSNSSPGRNGEEDVKKRKKFKRRKDDKKPKKPKTAYTYFQLSAMKFLWEEILLSAPDENREVQSRRVAQLTGQRWRAMSDEERRPFLEEAARARAAYKVEMAAYLEAQVEDNPAATSPSSGQAADSKAGSRRRKSQNSRSLSPKKKISGSISGLDMHRSFSAVKLSDVVTLPSRRRAQTQLQSQQPTLKIKKRRSSSGAVVVTQEEPSERRLMLRSQSSPVLANMSPSCYSLLLASPGCRAAEVLAGLQQCCGSSFSYPIESELPPKLNLPKRASTDESRWARVCCFRSLLCLIFICIRIVVVYPAH